VLELERVNTEARALHAGRVVLTAIAAVLFAIGWCVAKVCAAVWFVVAWCFAAVRLGWREARGTAPPAPSPSGWVELD
jgi:hypothetical protein